jgi:hypothetical protein
MARGVRLEPVARKWYEDTYNVTVKSMGFVIPKWEPRIGGSPDGLVGDDGIVEIKAPKVMYSRLKAYVEASKRGWVSKDFTHIWKTHYIQMQGYMAIMARSWCDYIVYCESDKCAFVQRIPFNYQFWTTSVYPRLKYFLDILCGNIKIQVLIMKSPIITSADNDENCKLIKREKEESKDLNQIVNDVLGPQAIKAAA